MKFDAAIGMGEDLASDEGFEANELDVYIEIDGQKVEVGDVALEEDETGDMIIVFRDVDLVAESLRPKGERKVR